MYSWIWRHLPFGFWGKLSGSLLLAGGVLAGLWFVVFPLIDPFLEENLLPWNDSQLESDVGPGQDTVDTENPDGPADPGDPAVDSDEGEGEEPVGPDGETLDDEHDIPYETDE